MRMIRIESDYHVWVDNRVIQAFKDVGVEVTEPARTMLAYLLQSQKEEGLAREDTQLFQRADDFLSKTTDLYVKLYGSQTMTINLAMHLIVETNRLYRIFPWGRSD